MKRSDAIEIICKCILFDAKADVLNYEESVVLANNILSSLEVAGMYPPAAMRYIDQENGNTLCSEVCEWDDE